MVSCDSARVGLERVNWSFPNSRTNPASVHSLHWFPGNFIPQIPSFLIQILSEPGAVVLDPFCGSGTTGVEALLLGRAALQSDLCRASIQVAGGKMATFEPSAAAALSAGLGSLLLEIGSPPQYVASGCGTEPRLSQWFHPSTLDQLRLIWTSLVETAQEHVRPLFEML